MRCCHKRDVLQMREQTGLGGSWLLGCRVQCRNKVRQKGGEARGKSCVR